MVCTAWSGSAQATVSSQISVGMSYTCMLQSDGTVKCWGDNSQGQLGDGTTDTPSLGTSVVVAGVASAKSIAGSCALTTAGAVKCWDDGSGSASTLISSGVDQISVGPGGTCALMSNGTVKCKGNLIYETGADTSQFYTIPGISGATQVSVGAVHLCAVVSGGGVKCWGSNLLGLLGDGNHGFGATSYGSAVSASGVSGATKVSAGSLHTCALISGGTVKCWGNNTFGMLGNGSYGEGTESYTPATVSGLQGVTDLQSNFLGTCVLLSNYMVKCWGVSPGRETKNRLSDPDQTMSYNTSPTTVAGLSQVSSLSSSPGYFHNCVITNSTSVRCWGDNQSGEFGVASPDMSDTPVLAFLTPPHIIRQPSNPMVSPDTVLEWSGEIGATFECSLDGVEYGDCTDASPTDLAGADPGDYTIYIRQVLDGNTSAPAVVSFTVSANTPDAPTITQPEQYSNSASASINFYGNDGASFECSLDNGTWEACSSPFTTSSLQDGSHQLSIRQTVLGLTSAESTVSWTIDTTKPAAPVISGAPDPYTQSTSANLSFTGEDGASFVCIIDGNSTSGCQSPQNRTGLADGTHSLTVQQYDLAGNVSDPATVSWVVDTTAPSMPTVNVPSSPSYSSSASVSFSGESYATFECSLDDVAFASCTSPRALTGLASGSHNMRVRQTDRAGNVSSIRSSSWTIVPVNAPTITSKPSAYTNTVTASIAFSGISGASFSCKVDSGNWASCSSPLNLSKLSVAAHTVSIKQTIAGVTSDLAVVSWTIDKTPPAAPTVTSQPDAFTTSKQASIAFSGEDGAVFQCSFNNNSSFSNCSSPYAKSNLTDAAYSFYVRQVDQAGNASTSSSVAWKVDTTAPVAPVIKQPTTPNSSSSISLSWTGESNAAFECALDGGNWASCVSPRSLTDLSEGAHQLSVRQTDQAGNQSSAAQVTWVVDLTAPEAPTISNTDAARIYTANNTVSWTGSGGGGYQCSLDEGNWIACSSPQTWTNLTLGDHSVKVRQSDPAGNWSQPSQVTWTYIDAPAPVVSSFDLSDPSAQQQSVAKVAGKVRSLSRIQPAGSKTTYTNADILNYQVSFDRAVTGLDASDFKVTSTARKSWTVQVVSGSGSGPYNIQLSSTAVGDENVTLSLIAKSVTDDQNWVGPKNTITAATVAAVDRTKPASPKVIGVPVRLSKSTTGSLTVNGESNAVLQCSLDGADWTTCTSPWSLTDLQDGLHTVKIRQRDLAGNWSAETQSSWTARTGSAPLPTILAKPESQTAAKDAVVWFSGEGYASFKCKLDEGDWENCGSPWLGTGLAAGNHQLQVKQMDEVGNASDPVTVSWTVDSSPASIRARLSSGTDSINCSPLTNVSKGTAVTYYWMMAGKVIAAGKILKLNDSLWGHEIYCLAVTNKAGVSDALASSVWNSPIPKPVISANMLIKKAAKTMIARVTRWKYGPVTITYQWQKNGVVIDGATGSTYTWSSADAGSTITCVVTVTNSSGSTIFTRGAAV